jgi:hypothetical protein
MADLSALDADDRVRAEAEQRANARTAARVSSLESGLGDERKRVRADVKDLEGTLKSLKGQLDSVADSLRATSDERDKERREVRRLLDGLSAVEKDVAQLGDNFARVTRDVEMAVAASNEQRKTVKIQPSDDVELINTLIDSALERYSKDILAQPDFALYTAGARIIPSLTSRTYEVRPKGLGSRMLASLTGMGVIRGRPPVTAIHPDTSVGSCWPFSGTTAQLGILLSRRVVVSDVTIEHASKDVAFDVSSAPQDFELWGVVEDDADVRKLKEYRSALEARQQQDGGDERDAALASSSPNHVLLAKGSYDANESRHIQTFSALDSTRSLDLPVSVVILRILNTHGNPAFGCLYRVRVGGETIEAQ